MERDVSTALRSAQHDKEELSFRPALGGTSARRDVACRGISGIFQKVVEISQKKFCKTLDGGGGCLC